MDSSKKEKILEILKEPSCIFRHRDQLENAVDAVFSLFSDTSSSESSSFESESSSSEESVAVDEESKQNINEDLHAKEIESTEHTENPQNESSSEELAHEQNDQTENFIKVINLYSNKEFKSQLKLERKTVEFLIEKYSQHLVPSSHCGGKPMIDARTTIYIYIWYVTKLTTFTQLSSLFGVAKSTAWLAVNRVSSWLISISQEYVKWPKGDASKQMQKKFQEKSHITGVVGVIDCMHILIRCPKEKTGDYFNKEHNNFSIILQAVVDADKKFTEIYCGEPGSMETSQVLRKSKFWELVTSEFDTLFPNSSFILGKCGYPSTSWLVPPFPDTEDLTEQQRKFNEFHASTRIVAKNAFEMLTGRFQRLLKRIDTADIDMVVNVVSSACILHNICIDFDDLYSEFATDEKTAEKEGIDLVAKDAKISNENRRDRLFRQLCRENKI